MLSVFLPTAPMGSRQKQCPPRTTFRDSPFSTSGKCQDLPSALEAVSRGLSKAVYQLTPRTTGTSTGGSARALRGCVRMCSLSEGMSLPSSLGIQHRLDVAADIRDRERH